jgi:hypothetical protein
MSKTTVLEADYSFYGVGLMVDTYDGARAAQIRDLTIYNVNTMGVWAPNVVLAGLKVADVPWGVLPSDDVVIEDALFVGRTANNRLDGAYDSPQNFLTTSSSFAISPHSSSIEVRRTRFVNYPANTKGLNGRSTSAAITHRHYHLDARFKLSASRFVNSQPFQLRPEVPPEQPDTVDRTWWDDSDGSVSGAPASYRGYGTAGDRTGCTLQSDWRAYICPFKP